MNFYEEIVHKIFTHNTTIGPTRLYWKDFIEAMHDKAEYKGVTYYSNIMHVMPNHFGADLYPVIFKETLQYCKDKIDSLSTPIAPQPTLTPASDKSQDEPEILPEAGIQYLDEHFVGLFKSVESGIEKAERPISVLPKIRRAALVEIMFEKKWFISKVNRIKTSNDFASARYGEHVEIQLSADKKTERQTHKSQLKKYF